MSSEVVVVGAVGAPFGVRGWVHVRSFTEPPENLLGYEPWQIATSAAWREVSATAKPHGHGFVARIDAARDRDAASALRGHRIGVAAGLLPVPEDGEHYWRDLVGRSVVYAPADAAPEQPLGVVARVFATPAHDVLVVANGRRERLIPFVRQFVLAVDDGDGRMIVDWHPEWE